MPALVVIAGPTWAADVASLPSPAPPYLGTCGTIGDGFRLPGTDGCLRINGDVTAEAGLAIATPALSLSRGGSGSLGHAGPGNGDLTRSGLAVGTRLSADVRLPTDYGPVRVFMSLRGRNGLAIDRAPR